VDATPYAAHSRFQVNHYWVRSEQEFRAKWTTSDPSTGLTRNPLDFEDLVQAEAEVGQRDEAILHYVPALRTALSRARSSAAGPGS
jgi:hypothetical protein